ENPGIHGFVVNSRDVTDRHRAQERIQSQFERLTALHAIDSLINASFDLHITLSSFLEQVTALMNVDAASVLLCNPHTCMLEYVGTRGLRNKVPRSAQLKLDHGLAGRAILERRLLLCEGVSQTPDVFEGAPFLSEEGFVACLAVPLLAKRQVKGVLQ